MLLNVQTVTKYFGAELIFSAVGFQVARGEKVALVGPNGAGKSTLLKIIAGQEQADEGSVHLARGNRRAYLAQEVRFAGTPTLWEALEAAFAHLNELEAEMRALEAQIADTAAPEWEARMQRYGELTARFEHAGGYQREQRIERALQGLGFHPAQYAQPVAQMSGGQRTRAGLATTLLSDPDLLLLDEPTNHLDLQALAWLESFLQSWDGTLLVISHDRYFLDRVTRRTLDMAFGRLEDYPAGYNRFLELKAERLEQRMKEYTAQQEHIARTEEFIRRYKAGQRSNEAKGREKRLNRLKDQHLIARPQQAAELKLFLDNKLRSGDLVLALEGLVIGHGNRSPDNSGSPPKVLLRADGVELQRGERVALIGPNGCGKTTLLRTLLREITPMRGAFRLGHNVQPGYYAQGHDGLHMDATVLDELLRASPRMGEAQARNLLGRFLFSGDDVFKRVGDLSGGERSRVALAQLTQLPGNLLLLDEPTNHLDIDAREALEATLQAYPGSILFVSHDRYLIDALADKLWVVRDGHVTEFLGSYSAYMAHEEAEQRRAQEAERRSPETSPAGPASKPPVSDKAERQRQRQLARLEAEVEALEQELARVQAALDDASAACNIDEIAALGEQYAALEQQLEQRYEAWSQLAA